MMLQTRFPEDKEKPFEGGIMEANHGRDEEEGALFELEECEWDNGRKVRKIEK